MTTSADPAGAPRAPGTLAWLRERIGARFAERTAESRHAADLRTDAQRAGAVSIAEIHPGDQVTVAGTVRSLTIRPRAGVPALEAELYDGSGSIALIWLGRREIRGIEPGRGLIARGRATRGRDSLVVYNAGYELRPDGPA